jgi:hypothetical protein
MKDIQATEEVSRPQEKISTSPNQSCGKESEAGRAWNFLATSDQVGSGSNLVEIIICHSYICSENFNLQHYYTPELIP